MNLQIIPFKVAKDLKELGFSLPTTRYYFEDGELRINKIKDSIGMDYGEEVEYELDEFYENWNTNWVTTKNGDICYGCTNNRYMNTYSAPTQAGVVKYFRDIYDIHIQLSYVDFETSEYVHITGYRLNIIFGKKVKGTPFNYILASEELTEKYYGGISKGHGIVFDTYEEAELEGIKEAIKYLKNVNT